MPCCLGGTDQRQTCFAGTSEARLDGAAESVALQGALRVHTFGRCVRQQRHGHVTNRFQPIHQRLAVHEGEHVAANHLCLGDVAEVCQCLSRTHTTVQDPQQCL